MRAAVVVPPIKDFYFTPHRGSFLGARTVAAVFERAGHHVDLFPFPVSGKMKPIPLPPELAHLEPFLLPREAGPTSFFTTYRRFGPPIPLCADRIIASRPHVVLISSIAYCYLQEAIDLAVALRRRKPNVRIVGGGPGIACAAERVRETGAFDALVVGEVEGAVEDVLERRTDDSCAVLSAVVPEQPLFVPYVRRTKHRSFVSVQLSRGCSHGCEFCSTHLLFGRRVRRTPPTIVAESLAELDLPPPVHVNIEDDNIMLDRGYAFEIFEAIRSRWPEATFSAENGLDYRALRSTDIDALCAVGFSAFNFTVATTDDEVLERQRRSGDPDHLYRLLRTAADLGVPSVTYFICGLAGDSPATVTRTLSALAAAPTRVGISPFYPVPGLAGYESMARDASVPPRLTAGSSAYPWTGALSTAQIVTAFRFSRLVNLAKRRKRPREEDELLRRCFAERRLLTMLRVGGGLDVARPPGLDEELERGFFDAVPADEIEAVPEPFALDTSEA